MDFEEVWEWLQQQGKVKLETVQGVPFTVRVTAKSVVFVRTGSADRPLAKARLKRWFHLWLIKGRRKASVFTNETGKKTNAGNFSYVRQLFEFVERKEVDANSSVEKKFARRMRDNYKRAGRETGYWGNYFNRDLVNLGAVVTAKKMLRPPKKKGANTGGLQKLIDAGRTDLSIETTVLEKQFRGLFTEEELAEAKRRLDVLPEFTQRVDIPPEKNFPDEVPDDAEFIEGRRRKVMVNAYERNPAARSACISKHGYRCVVCGMSFEKRYGEIGRRFIHVHHKKPLAGRREEYVLIPTVDLAPVCPNCHAMLHTKNPPLGIDELKVILREHKAKKRGS